MLKYGFDNFNLEILEFCTVENVLEREQYYIDLLKPEYNILKEAGNSLGYEHSEETLELMRNREISEETRKLLSLSATGRVFSDEDKLKLSEKRKGIKLSDVTRTKISEAAIKLRGVGVEVEDKILNTKLAYKSLTEAAKSIDVSRTAISKVLNTGKLIKNRYLINSFK